MAFAPEKMEIPAVEVGYTQLIGEQIKIGSKKMLKEKFKRLGWGVIILIIVAVLVSVMTWKQYEKEKTCETQNYCYYFSPGFVNNIKVYVECENQRTTPNQIYTEERCIN